jgi:hypothetical protein
MHLILFAIGAALAVAGVVMVRYAMPVEDVAQGAHFTSGFVMHVGGLIVIALAAAVRVLNRIAERLEIQPLPVPPVASVARDDPAPRPARVPVLAPDVPAARSSLLGWFAARSGAAPAKPAAPPPATTPEPQVDLGPLARLPETPREPPPLATPPAPPPVAPAIPRVEPKPAVPPRPPVAARPAPVPNGVPTAQNGTPATTVYRSGVIDGMAYTLFMDGSIQAELPQGTVKFATIDELQKYLLEKR